MSKKDIKNSVNSSLSDIQKDKSFEILKLALDEVKEKYNVSSNEIFNLIERKKISKEVLIPISIFEVKLSALEAICKYLSIEEETKRAQISFY